MLILARYWKSVYMLYFACFMRRHIFTASNIWSKKCKSIMFFLQMCWWLVGQTCQLFCLPPHEMQHPVSLLCKMHLLLVLRPRNEADCIYFVICKVFYREMMPQIVVCGLYVRTRQSCLLVLTQPSTLTFLPRAQMPCRNGEATGLPSENSTTLPHSCSDICRELTQLW